MKKTAFYIVERPADNQDYNEFKYDGEDETNLAPLEVCNIIYRLFVVLKNVMI